MAFRVELSPEAFGDLDRIAIHIQTQASFATAERWFNGIIVAIASLSEMPQRCSLAEESTEIGAQVRLLLFGKRNRRYKTYFAIHQESQTVRVFHIRHWAMQPIEADELGDLMDESSSNGGEGVENQ